MPYAFISHGSALEALRVLEGDCPTWPDRRRLLPVFGDCVRNQRMFRDLCSSDELDAWGIRSRPVDVLTPHANMRSKGKTARFHVWKWPLPTDSMIRLSDNVLVSKPAFVLVQMSGSVHPKMMHAARKFSEELSAGRKQLAAIGINEEPVYDDLRTWELVVRLVELTKVVCELLGTYRIGAKGEQTRYRLPPLMTRDEAADMLGRLPGLYGAGRVRQAMELAFDRSASPMETALALMLTLPPEIGGFGLPRPELNVPLDVQGLDVVHAWRDEISPDLLWREKGLVVEYESDEFHAKKGKAKLADDASRANALAAQGYAVLRALDKTVQSIGELELLARQVAAVLQVPLVELDPVGKLRRERLHGLLLG